MQNLSDMSGTTALVTGASGGIGAKFAAKLAQRGADLVLVARSGDKLEALASSLRPVYGVRVLTLELDLSEPESPRAMFDWAVKHGVEVGFLVNNAGGGIGGAASKADPAAIAAMVTLNGLAVVESTVHFLPGMVTRGHGTIINVTSASAFLPTPYLAAYGGSKAMALAFTLAVGVEVADAGVQVLAVSPGVTVTGQQSQDILPAMARFAGLRQPEQVVTTAFRALSKGKVSVVDGRRNALFAHLVKRLPDQMASELGRRLTTRLSGL